MRIVYFGSGSFSVPSLRAVLAGGHEAAGIYTQPARPSGRGGRTHATAVADAAREAGRDVIECPNVNDDAVVAEIRSARADVICVADFGQMLGRAVLESTRLGAFNVHASLLPELRGAAPIQWALIRGYRRTGVTAFRIVEAMDAGAIYLQAATDIGPDETAGELKARLAEMGAELACETLGLLAGGSAEPREQDESRATPAPRLKKADGVIDWSAAAESIGNLVRGTWPWPGGQAVLRRGAGPDVAVTIARAAAAPGEAASEPGVLDGELCAATGAGRLWVAEIRPAGKRLMAWRDFVNGYRVRPGDRFGRADEA